MALELIRDMLRFDQVVGEGQSQTLVDRDIIVPDIKPDIARILSVEGKVNITSREAVQDRIALEGTVNFEILYAANEEPQPIYSMSHAVNFSHFIDVIGAAPKMNTRVVCNIEHTDFNKINGRKLNLQCVLNMKGKVTDKVPIDIVKEVSGVNDIQLLKDTVVIDEPLGDNTAQIIVKEILGIPDDYPSIEEIVKCKPIIHKKNVDIEEGKLIISGNVLVPILYSSRGEKVDIFKVEKDMVFTHTVEMPGVMPGMACDADFDIENVYTELKDEGEEKRNIDVEVVVNAKLAVTEKIEVPVILDIYAPSARIDSEKKNAVMDLFFGANSSQAVVKESMPLSQDVPDMDKVYDMVCQPAVTECKIVDDKVVVEGVVGFDLIYLVRGEERLVHSFSDELPFRASVVIPGCKIYMKPEVTVGIESMEALMLTKNEVEIKIALGCNVKVYERVNRDFIIKAEIAEGDIPIHKASITIYMVQPKDTLWKIAKRYYTTVEDIVKVNEVPDPDNINPGFKLIIPRKM